MNNSFLAFQNIELEMEVKEELDKKPVLRARETEIIKILEAINNLSVNKDWLTLKDLIFDNVVEVLKKEREREIEKQPINGPKVHSLNGQLAWAKKYSNISNLASIYKLELDSIRKQL